MAKIEYKDIKLYKKEKRGKWVDKNWQYLLEGWTIIFILLLITLAVYSIGLREENWNSIFFLNAVINIGLIMFMILVVGFTVLMILSKDKIDFLYFCSFLGMGCFCIIATIISKHWIFLVASIFSDVVIGCFYSILRCNQVIADKNVKIGFNNIKLVLAIIIPALTPIIASLIKK